MAKQSYDARTDPDVPKGMSIELLKDLYLLTRDGQLNADARRKLKQIRHLVGLLSPALDDALARSPSPIVVDCGAGKSYLGALLYELVLGPAGKGSLVAIEARPELSEQARSRAQRFGQQRFEVLTGAIGAIGVAPSTVDGDTIPDRLSSTLRGKPNVVTALHACDTATDDALVLAIANQADHVAVVPCCQAEVARQLESVRPTDPAIAALFAHPLHRRELGSHLTNVVRGLVLEAHGYKVTVTELVGWEHSAKNELILGKRVQRFDPKARAALRELLDRFGIEPTLVRGLTARGLDPRTPPT
ncbi:MAG: class I SAM-dependent methyltransferase [Kofleriaceae bacterium]